MSVANLLHDVEFVEHLGGHWLRLRFDDGFEGEVDLRDVVSRFGGVLAPLADPQFVAQVRIQPDSHTITWPGELDLDPVVIYCVMKGIPVPGEDRPRSRRPRPAAQSRRRSG
jgi:hypothetical protein